MQKLAQIKSMQAKKQRADLKKRKQALETTSQKIKKTQMVVNEYIRLRDAGKQCITCDKILTGKFDAGHYFNANNHHNLRFDPVNINGQCVRCNRSLHGALIQYRKSIVDRWGIQELIRLESMAYVIRKFTPWELDEIKAEFKKRVKELKKNNK